jgi:hypothetical protein
VANVFFKNDNQWKIDSEKLFPIFETKQRDLVNNLIGTHAGTEKRLPSVVCWEVCFFKDFYIYIFLRMLLINLGIAFFLGFFAQIAFQSTGYKEPI